MRWKGGRRSENLQDRRGQSAFNAGGLLNLLPMLLSGRGRGGIGVVVVILVVLWIANGGLPQFLTGGAAHSGELVEGLDEGETADFVSVVLASTEDVWSGIFAQAGAAYRAPDLVLFDRQVSSACGFQSSATGPFYCPTDERVYLDLEFFRQLAALGGAGDFAAAYVVGHEVGHHVQHLLGAADRLQDARSRAGAADVNALSVMLELQADCYAGVWAYHTDRNGVVTLSDGDVEEGLEAARAIGDDRLQAERGGSVHPESFTHGTSEQRARWLRTGLSAGDPDACETVAP